MVTISVAFEGQPLSAALHDQIEAKRSNLPIRRNAISLRSKALHHFAFELRLPALFLFVQAAHQAARVFGVLDQLPTEVVGLQIVVGTQRVYDPHLIARAACRDVESLLEEFLVPQRERAAL